MMEFRIEPTDDDGTVSASLFRWLRDDPDTQRDVVVALTSSILPGSMGALDLITALVTQATGVGSLAVAYATWRDTRSRPSTLRITLGELSVEIQDESAEQLTVILTAPMEQDRARRGPQG